MSGHNKWSTIKHKKGAADAKRGKLFTKISKELTVAARIGGGDPAGNPRLRLAISKARAASMPADTMDRAIKKGTGELDGGQLEELTYEGYGPGGVAFILDVTTDNSNRSLSEIRNALEKSGGSLAKTGAVSFQFSRKGMIRLDAGKYSEDQVMEATLEAGPDDILSEDGQVVVYTSPMALHAVKEALEAQGMEPATAEIAMIPSSVVRCDLELARKTVKLVEKLEDNDDVQAVWANYDIPDDVMGQLEQEA